MTAWVVLPPHQVLMIQLGLCVTSSLRRLVKCESRSGRRRAGEGLPPPPKTALAGPEYFGLIHPDTIAKIETLDPDQSCTTYWEGKQERLAFGQVSIPLHRSAQVTCMASCSFPLVSGGAKPPMEWWIVVSNSLDGPCSAVRDAVCYACCNSQPKQHPPRRLVQCLSHLLQPTVSCQG